MGVGTSKRQSGFTKPVSKTFIGTDPSDEPMATKARYYHEYDEDVQRYNEARLLPSLDVTSAALRTVPRDLGGASWLTSTASPAMPSSPAAAPLRRDSLLQFSK